MQQPIPIAEIPPFLNDYRVLAALPLATRADVMIVLVDRGSREPERFVVAEWQRGCGATWQCGDYHENRVEAFRALLERSQTPLPIQKPHDSGAKPPEGFTRYQIEMNVPDEIDSSMLLEFAQEWSGQLIEAIEDDEGPAEYDVEANLEAVSVQQMEG